MTLVYSAPLMVMMMMQPPNTQVCCPQLRWKINLTLSNWPGYIRNKAWCRIFSEVHPDCQKSLHLINWLFLNLTCCQHSEEWNPSCYFHLISTQSRIGDSTTWKVCCLSTLCHWNITHTNEQQISRQYMLEVLNFLSQLNLKRWLIAKLH